MKIIIVENSEEFGKAAFNEVYKVVKNNPSATLGLATGSTPLPLYAEMVKDHRDRGTSYKDVRTFNLDEYVGLPASHKESYVNFMTRNLFSKIDVDMKNVNIPVARRKTSTKNVQGIPPCFKTPSSIFRFWASAATDISLLMSRARLSTASPTAYGSQKKP